MTPPTPRDLLDDADALAWCLSLARGTDDLYLRVPAEGLRMDSNLRDELGVDSIGLVTLFYAVCDCFGLDVDESEASEWSEVGQVVAFARRCAAGDT